MIQFVVREVEWGGDVDGTGPERWLGRELGRFDTEDEALDFVDDSWTVCEVVEEETKKEVVSSTSRPAYYDAEGGSMWNGIGRSYF